MLKDVAVRTIKPVLSDAAWQRLRHLSPAAKRADERRAAKAKAKAARAKAAADLSNRSLTEIAQHFRTDKAGRHRYTQHYERYLKHLRKKKFTLLEIGIGGYQHEGKGGASLRMWKAFFPQASILGLDIEDKSFVDEDRITTFQGSQTDPEVLARVLDSVENLQVIVDDGSHRSEHILATFEILFPKLPVGGIYVIEDTQTSYWPRYGGTTDPTAPTSMNFVKELVDGVNYEEYTDKDHVPSYTQLHITGIHVHHNLVFIEKGMNNEGTPNRGRMHVTATGG